MEQSSQCHYGQGNAFGHGYVGENPNTSAYNYGYQNVDNNGNGIHGQQRASVPSNHPLGDHPQADFQHASQPQVPNAHSRSAFNHGQQLLHVRRSGYTTKPEDLYTDLDPFVNSDLALNQTTNGKNSHLPGTATANGYYQTEETDEPVDLSNDSGEEREERSDDQDHVMTEDEDGFVGEAYGVPNEPIDEQDDDCQVASAPHNSSHDQSEHAPACKRAPRPTTPKPTRSGRTPADFLAGPVYARKDKDLRTGLQNQHRFHVRAKGFRPDVPLAEHRYWIGVLKTDKRPKTANEKSFICTCSTEKPLPPPHPPGVIPMH